MKLSFPELIEKSTDVYDDYAISYDQVSLVQENTHEQANSRIWFQQRSGRVTASKLKRAIATDPSKPSHSLIKSTCYSDLQSFKSAACIYMEFSMRTLHKRNMPKECLKCILILKLQILD